MPRVHFTPNLQRHVACPSLEAPGETVAEVLRAAFSDNETARSYVLDEHGALREHMVVFVDGRPIRDRRRMSDPVRDDSELYVFQALSGG